MSAKNRNPILDAAILLVKGAICTVLNLPLARTTKSMSFDKNMKAKLVVGPVAELLNDEQQDQLHTLISAKILEDAPFDVINVSRALAEEKYGETIFDDYGIPHTITQLRLIALKNMVVNANINPVVSSTSSLGRILIEKYKLNEAKQTLEVSIGVFPPLALDETPAVATEREASTLEDLPCLTEVAPENDYYKDIVAANEKALAGDDDQEVTPWDVKGGEKGIDYDKLIRKFGCQKITPALISRIETLTGVRAHRFLRRELFFSHRDLDTLLNAYQKGMPFYLYTGRGPASESLHLGHLVPFMFTKYLQDVFKVPLVIQLTDDEKFLFKENLSLEDTHRLGYENAKDIIACGFDPDLTFIFSDLDYIQHLYPTILKIQKKVTYSTCRAMFGFTPNDNIGKSAFPAVQAAPSFPSAFPTIFGEGNKDTMCLIPQAIDQDPYFRMTRDISHKLGFFKPSLIHSKFLPALQGSQSKMSGSVTTSSIYVTDTPEEIRTKVFKYAYSGGKENVEQHRLLGGDLEVDVSYQYLRYLMEDDEQLEALAQGYKKGEILSSEMKQTLVDHLIPLMAGHQKRREAVTDDVVLHFMNPNRESFKKFHKKQ